MERLLDFYFRVRDETKNAEPDCNLTNDELKSIDEYEKIESGEDYKSITILPNV